METSIQLEALRIECLIGCQDSERVHPQTLGVDLRVDYAESNAMISDNLGDTWDYGHIETWMAFVLQAGRFRLLETACHFLTRALLLPPTPGSRRPVATQASVTLTKYGVLSGDARARVTSEARREEVRFHARPQSWGRIDIVAENRRQGLYRMMVNPGASLPAFHARRLRDAELVVNAGLLGGSDTQQNTPLLLGQVVQRVPGGPTTYRNTSSHPASILYIDTPTDPPKSNKNAPEVAA